MHPAAKHPGPLARQEPFPREKRDHFRPEQFLERLETHLGQNVEQPRAREKPVGHEGVKVRVKVEVLAEGVDGHDDT